MTPPTSSATAPSPVPWRARHRRALGLVGAVLAAGMTVLWTVVVPDKADAASGLQHALLRWGHAASWACLTGVGLAVATGAPRGVREMLAWGALASYGGFLLSLTL
ncbi:hypothetical protein [Ornithinimicrobium cerasi]|uniref:hypothetical protein n=1 Tax=Ornithinimicrobium cerasi TaxID=2248773 RepID=UPI000F00BA3F|nr:hypothetical protein [Ornithinimicrobium cerasi]